MKSSVLLCQIFDAGEVFGIMHFQQEEVKENGEDKQEEKNNNPGFVSCKVIVTRESGLQASEPTRWGQL